MFSPHWFYQFTFGALCFGFFSSQVEGAFNVNYCSNLNTASTPKNSSIYQSNGLCEDFCIEKYAFAVVQDDGCWCSNYAPGSTTSGCDHTCPGYPPELCGGNNVYGYIALNVAPLGTQGGSSSAAPPTSSTSPKPTSALQVTVTATPQAVTIVLPPATSSSDRSTSSSSPSSTTSTISQTSSSSSSTWTPTPVTSLETVTGQVRTVTVTPTIPPTAGSASGITGGNKKKTGLGVGAAVGLTIGLVALAAIIGTIVFCCIKKHRRANADEYNASRRGSSAGLGSAGGFGPSRTMSQSSRFVLNTDGRQVVETWEPGDNAPGTRSSRLMPVDPRLDPFAAVYQRGENKSRESINTIRDDHDYSRRVAGPGPILRATNPDHPEP